jgi:hypothetical protein
MKNIMCQNSKHTGLWSIAPQQPVWANIGLTMTPSIRGSEFNYDTRLPGSFIDRGVGSK